MAVLDKILGKPAIFLESIHAGLMKMLKKMKIKVLAERRTRSLWKASVDRELQMQLGQS